jgi:CheY-like chemotaxis protein
MGVPRVLVVDDEQTVREIVERIFQRAGCDAISAASGAEALRVVQDAAPFDLFVLDLHMPGMTGEELARQLRQTNPDIRVLFCTGYAGRLFREKSALRWGHEAYVDKPVTVEGLLEVASLLLFGGMHGLPIQDAAAAAS